jgi:redox-sensitive bicupin YhaK (pirin superfamily)
MEATKLSEKQLLKGRTVAQIIDSIETLEGGGFLVRRPFPQSVISEFDPFLLLDEMGPVTVAPGEANGAPDHPHRGFETVTYMLSGEFEHKDSHGHAGKLRPGDVQWMTAGAGVVHSEMPSERIQREGGKMHGFQLWVNLPRKDKMMTPRYQEIPSAQIPEGRTDDGLVTVRVIAGESLGARAVIDTITPIMYLHFVLKPGGRVVQPVPANYNAFTYVIDGEGDFGSDATRVKDGQMVTFASDGGEVTIANPANARSNLEVLLLAGVPLNELVARYGPFVMNTRSEIYQAIDDYQSGRMGEIDF